MKIKDLPSIERPREKMLRYGVERLATAELLAVILGTGRKGENALQLSRRLLLSLRESHLPLATWEELETVPGLGEAKACVIMACFELSKRLLQGKKSVLVLTPEEVWQQLYDISDQKKEHFVVFYLDVRNQIIKREIISIGTLTASLVHPREVFEPAVREGAAQIILSHNHPSGIVEPSDEDIGLTQRLLRAGEILGIEIIDHIIVAKNNYLSFKEQKYL